MENFEKMSYRRLQDLLYQPTPEEKMEIIKVLNKKNEETIVRLQERITRLESADPAHLSTFEKWLLEDDRENIEDCLRLRKEYADILKGEKEA